MIEESKEASKTLLIVDDDLALCRMTKEFLSMLAPSLEIRTTTSSLEALNLVISDHIDYILSDFMMPEMNGLELLEAIKKIEYNIPVIILTGHPVEIIGPKAQEQGALACFQKGNGISTYYDILNLLHT